MNPVNATDAVTPVACRARLRGQLRRVTLSWGLGYFWLFTITGAAMTKFARGLGMPDYGFGILAAMPHIATLFQLPGSYLVEHYRHRRRLFIVAMTISRLSWVIMAMIPWLLPGVRQIWWTMLVLITLLAWSANHLAVPAWTSWMADIVPSRLRGRFFGNCQRYAQPIVIVGALGVGYVIDVAETSRDVDLLLQVTSSVLALAGLVGSLGIGLYRRVDDPPRSESLQPLDWLGSMWQPLRESNFRRYLGLNFTFMLSIGFLGQYIWVYMFDVGLMKAWMANLLLAVVPRFVHMYSYTAWGRQIDRLGRRPVAIFAVFLMLIGPIAWFMVGQQDPLTRWVGVCLAMTAAFSFSGFEAANLNMLLAITESRAGKGGGSAYAALNGLAVAAGGVLSGLVGWAVAKWCHTIDWTIPVVGWAFTYHGLLLAISLVLRACLLPWLFALREPTATPASTAIRYMSTNVYSNVRQAAVMPTRVVGRIRRWTYRINGQR